MTERNAKSIASEGLENLWEVVIENFKPEEHIMLSHEQIDDFKRDLDNQELPNWFWKKHPVDLIYDQAKAYTTLKAKVDKVLGMEPAIEFGLGGGEVFNEALTTIKQTLKGEE